MLLRLLLLGALAALAHAQADQTDYTPIVVPLAVRGPYLGSYLTGRRDKTLVSMDPHFWTTAPVGWKGLLRVDGKVWNWMGDLTEWPACINASITHTAAETSFTLTDDPPTVALTASFLSPVTPADLFRQSLPFSYLHLSAASLDGQSHTVEVYSEVNGLWLADEEEEELEWAVVEGANKDWVGVRARLRSQRTYAESYKQDEAGEWVSTDRIMHGDVYYASSASGTTFSAGDDAMVTRREFTSTGHLSSKANSISPRPIRTRSADNVTLVLDEPVFALAHSFGTVSASDRPLSRSALIAIGHVRTPIVHYMTPDPSSSSTGPDGKTRAGEKLVDLQPLWRSTFHDAEKMLSFFLADYPTAKKLSDEFNAKLYADARAVDGQEYANVVAVSTRQVFMAMEAVWDESEEGSDAGVGLVAYSPITGEPIPAFVMLKEISSNGNVNTVDVVAPFLPFLLYASPSLLPLLLEATYRYMASGLYVPVPPAHDLGDHYPNATAHNEFLYPGLPLEEAGNMLLLAYAGMSVAEPATAPLSAHQRVVQWWDQRWNGNVASQRIGWEATVGQGRDHRREGARMAWAQARERYGLLKRWAGYLEEECLYPGDQRTTDDFFGSAPNQTSLVIKSILGMNAFAEIADAFGHHDDRDHFRSVVRQFRETFLDLAISPDKKHLLGSYNNQTGWNTQYNLYFDKLLGMEVFPGHVYEMQHAFYPTIAEPYGPPLDSRFPNRAKTDWLAWAGATCPPGTPCRRVFLDGLARYFRQDMNAVFGDSITPQDGWSVGFLSRPVAGGHYAVLARVLMEQERQRRLQRLKEGTSESFFLAAVVVGAVLFALVASRAVRRWRRGRKGYIELGGAERGARRQSEASAWTAGDSPRSVFELEMAGEDDSGSEADEADFRRRKD
ncbi:hypothetical protein JCM10207_001583 [Rhodosporidiobolus poonsookiae]